MTIVGWGGFGGVPQDFAGLQGQMKSQIFDFSWHIPWLPGHGGLSLAVVDGVEDLAEIMVQEFPLSPKDARPILLGYSLGGRLALAAALRHPQRIRGLILLSASPGWPDSTPESEREKRWQQDCVWADWLEQMEDPQELSDFYQQWWKQEVFCSPRWQPAMYGPLIAGRCVHDPKSLAHVLRMSSVARQPSLWEKLQDLHVPTLVLAGEEDQRFAQVAEKMVRLLPHGECHLVSKAGHSLLLENPPTLADVLGNWLLRKGILCNGKELFES